MRQVGRLRRIEASLSYWRAAMVFFVLKTGMQRPSEIPFACCLL